MKILSIVIFILIFSELVPAQGMFTERGKFSLDIGTAYIYEHNEQFDAAAYNLSGSLWGLIDIGITYAKAFPSKQYKRVEGATAYLDFYAKKDSAFGLVLNMAFSTFNYNSAILAGISVFTKVNFIESFNLFSIPMQVLHL